MNTPPEAVAPTFLARVARKPLPVLLGLAVGFLGCCVAGRVAARQQPYKNFVRFHPGIAPDSQYYPTFSQTLNLARQHVGPGKTLVVVGGNSVMHGVGQRPAHVWTKHLQELLGDGYVVLNLAMRGQFPNEFGGVIAEKLAADGVPVVYVTIAVPNVGWDCGWDGGPTYRYFFWDGWGKGLIPDDPRRDPWLADGFDTQYGKNEAALEARRRGRVDAVTYSQDLWTAVADRFRGTVWTQMKYPRFWRPHRESTDTDPGSTYPWELANNEARVPAELAIMRGFLTTPAAKALLKGEQYDVVAKDAATFVPDALRPRALYVLRLEGTYYRKRMTPEEQTAYAELYTRYAEAVRAGGMNAVAVGHGYEEKDYFDRSHFSEQGGKKLAADLAPTVRAMNDKLYGPRAEGAKP